jgi:hypothetical protein
MKVGLIAKHKVWNMTNNWITYAMDSSPDSNTMKFMRNFKIIEEGKK